MFRTSVLSANNQSEINRMRQITKQKMENKQKRHQQPMITSTRQQSARYFLKRIIKLI